MKFEGFLMRMAFDEDSVSSINVLDSNTTLTAILDSVSTLTIMFVPNHSGMKVIVPVLAEKLVRSQNYQSWFAVVE